MHSILRTLVLSMIAAASLLGFQEARDSIAAHEIRSHLFFLASDRLEGRGAGTRGAEIAADYIGGRFMALGLQPLNGTYFQDVPLMGVTADPATLSLGFEVDGAGLPAAFPSDAVLWTGSPRRGIQVSGELLFVGYGIDAPEWGWDDYKGRDVTGKIVLILVGDPPAPPEEPGLFEGRAATYYGGEAYKLEEARRKGATGALIVHRPEAAGFRWSAVAASWKDERLLFRDEAEGAPVLVQGWLTARFARRALRQANLDLNELTALAARRDFRPIPTGITVRSRMSSRSRRVSIRNVVGYRPGHSDEVVVFTAHYDHLGIGPPVDGDSIYNGAYDAGGAAMLLEVADAFSRADSTGRGLLFIATSGAEAGLLGARHYVAKPLIPLARTAAVVNVDGANLWGETHDVLAPGAGYSTIHEVLERRAAELGLRVRDDPTPEGPGFFRSDHFPFARAGVPALYLRYGLSFRDRPAGWGHAVMARWRRERHRRPSDAFDPRADLAGAAQQARLIFSVGWDLANADTAPVWRQDAPFRAASDPLLP